MSTAYIVLAFAASLTATALVAIGVGWWVRRGLSAQAPAADLTALGLLQNQVAAAARQTAEQTEALRAALDASMHALNDRVSQSLSGTSQQVNARLEATARVIGDVRQQLGALDESAKRMLEVGQNISGLQDILQPPKLRGALGELFLSDLLAQILPAHHYALQHRFKGGATVDAVLRLQGGLVPVDAKFPLESFRRALATEGEEERRAARRAFVRDVKQHADQIAEKYIKPDEGTFEFALMYIPAENVYYEAVVRDESPGEEGSLFSHALKKRVIPVSPNSFFAYLQTILLGLKGMRVEESAREIVEKLSRLRKDLSVFSDAFRIAGQHLDNAGKKFAEAGQRLGKFEAKMEQVDGLAHSLDSGTEQAGALPPAEGPRDVG